jgi:hypothetical protein
LRLKIQPAFTGFPEACGQEGGQGGGEQEGGWEAGGLSDCACPLAGCSLAFDFVLLTVGCTFSLLQDSKTKSRLTAQTREAIFLMQ